jgi:predicted nucleic acid-binding protein
LVSHLLDTSVITRVSYDKPLVKEARKNLVGGSNIARCTMTDLEYCFSAENERQWDMQAKALAVYGSVAVEAADFTTALDLQRELARVGLAKRNAPGILIAAVAIHRVLTSVHYDAVFGHIASTQSSMDRCRRIGRPTGYAG